ncbi:PrpF protein-domain-containing protein [Aspergillus venezuelensis]
MDSSHGNAGNGQVQSSPRFRRRRAVEACSFCRRRKVRDQRDKDLSGSPILTLIWIQIKCNNERPVCVNCKAYGQDCAYEPINAKAREAGRQRHERRRSVKEKSLGTGNGQRPRSVGEPSLGTESLQRRLNDLGASPGSGFDGDADQSGIREHSEAEVARIVVSANVDLPPRKPDDWVERGLIAEAVKQRQMEQLNFSQGKLDFDGVDPDLGIHLLSLHWNRQHHSFLITYRPAFMRDMACGGPYPRLEVRKDPHDVRTAGWKYRERVRELLGGALDRSDITTIQALLVMTNSLFALGDERSAAWLYSGLAFRMLIDMGMHVDLTNTRRFSDEDLELRRRVFWAAFVVDKIQSLYQGRPVSLKETDALVPIKFLDTYEELEHWQPFAYSNCASNYPGIPAYSTSTFASLCKLSLIMSDILSCIYTKRSFNQNPNELANKLEDFQLRLDQWEVLLPDQLQFHSAISQSVTFPPPHVFSLQAMHNSLVILLHRPFVADGHLYNTSRSIAVDSFKKCASAASNIGSLLRAYHRAFSVTRAPYLIPYATYVAATILTRIAAKRRNDSVAHSDLATCLAVFAENQGTNSAVGKAAIIIRSLMNKFGVVVEGAGLDALALTPYNVPDCNTQAVPHDLTSDHHNQMGYENGTYPDKTGDTAARPQRVATADKSSHSSGSEWVDIDGIIQSFLSDTTDRGTRQLNSYADGGPSQSPGIPWTAADRGVAGGNHDPAHAVSQPELQAYPREQGWTRPCVDLLSRSICSNFDSGRVEPSKPLTLNPLAMAIGQVPQTRPLKRHVLPCVLMRAETSKGIFLHQGDLPARTADWAPHLISALGSRGNDSRQIDGIGGGTSTTSKVAVIRRSQRPDADVDWTFVQVAVGKESIDLTGTCGNMTSGVAPFAVQEGLVEPQPGQKTMDVRIYNTNTDRIVIETVLLDGSGDYEEDGTFIIPGVNSPGSEVKCKFVKPVGSMTGNLFPSKGLQQQTLRVEPGTLMPGLDPFDVRVTLIDSANPFVLIDSTSIATALLGTISTDTGRHALVESIRRAGAVAMGLATNIQTAGNVRGTPKAALVYPPKSFTEDTTSASQADIRVQAYSMGLPHPSLQLTGAVTVAVALSCPWTIVAELSARDIAMAPPLLPTPEQSPPPDDLAKKEHESWREVLIGHPKGTIKVDVEVDKFGDVASCSVSRTARRLFEGKVKYYVHDSNE